MTPEGWLMGVASLGLLDSLVGRSHSGWSGFHLKIQDPS